MDWLEKRKNDLDVLCFQELKGIDAIFPFNDFENYGYTCEVYGQKKFNGVAICSKLQLRDLKKGFNNSYWDEQKRIITGKIGDINIINVYAPHGDLRGGEKYHYKLYWFEMLVDFLNTSFSKEEKILLVGDLNVARSDLDVYDPVVVKDLIGTMVEERLALKKILDWGLTDTFRHLYPEDKQFTWWDYIGGAIWRNEGMRIDYVLCSKPLIEKIRKVEVDLWPRRRRIPKPSDHAPVIVTLQM